MKLILENWRQYKNQLINEAIPDQTLAYVPSKADVSTIQLDPDLGNMLLDTANNVRKALAVVEPTGIASWPDLISAISAFSKDQSLSNAGDLALAIVSVIPGAKYAAATSKLSRLSKAPRVSVTFGPVKPDTVKQSKALATRISDELATLPSGKQLSIDINKQLKNLPAVGRAAQALSPEEKYASIDKTKEAEEKRAYKDRRLGKVVTNCKEFLKFMGASMESPSAKPRSLGLISSSADFGPLYSYFHDEFGRAKRALTCKSLALAKKGVVGSKTPSQLFINSKPVKKLGVGAFGVAILLDNNHVVKFFIDGSATKAGKQTKKLVENIPELLEAYEKLYNAQFDGAAKPNDIAIYEYGTIPVDKSALDPSKNFWGQDFIGYVEMGKVTVFEDWISRNYLDRDRQQIWDFMNRLRNALIDAKPKSRIHTNGAVLKSFSEHAEENDLIAGSDKAAEAYTDYVLDGDPKSTWKRRKTAEEQEAEQKLQDQEADEAARKDLARRQRSSYDPTTYRPPKRIAQPETRAAADLPDQPLPDNYRNLWQHNTGIRWPGLLKSGLGATMPYLPLAKGIQGPVPQALRKDYVIQRPGTRETSVGEGYRFLRSFLKAIYRTASLNGDDYLYDRNTFDVHVENFGVAPRTVAADVDPSNPKAKKMRVDPKVIIFDR